LTEPLGPPFLSGMLWIPQFLRTKILLFAISSEFHNVPQNRRLDTIAKRESSLSNCYEHVEARPSQWFENVFACHQGKHFVDTHRRFTVRFDTPGTHECPSQSMVIEHFRSVSRHLLSVMYFSM
jgi:hypothetical protein